MNYITLIEIIVSILLIIFILFQQRGAALGSTFGGGGEFYLTKRGIQKQLFYGTIILGVIFIALAILRLLI